MTASTLDSQSKRPNLPESWLFAIEDEFATQQTRALKTFLIKERAQSAVYPPGRDMFNAFWLTPFEAVRVVILGQDPYHGPNQAHGLCFSVRKGVRPPPSLQNIFKELNRDCGIQIPRHGDLSSWAQQGVLLLNTVLSVRAQQANSHRGGYCTNDKKRQVLRHLDLGAIHTHHHFPRIADSLAVAISRKSMNTWHVEVSPASTGLASLSD